MINHEIPSPELAACEVHGMTRSSFILRGALATGALYGAGAVAPFAPETQRSESASYTSSRPASR